MIPLLRSAHSLQIRPILRYKSPEPQPTIPVGFFMEKNMLEGIVSLVLEALRLVMAVILDWALVQLAVN